MPPKISLESVYEGEAPKEVENDYKPPQQAFSQPSPAKAEPPKPAPEPTPVASRGPPPAMKDHKDSMASAASKFADKDEVSDNDSASSFEEIPKPAERRTFTAARQEEKTKGPVMTKEPETVKATPSHTPTPSVSRSAAPAASSPASTTASASTPSSGGPATALRDALGYIKSQLEQQNKVMSDQSDQIAILLREVSHLKSKVAAAEPSDREKDERIRQLELELEEARS